jgi:hypothetical protein
MLVITGEPSASMPEPRDLAVGDISVSPLPFFFF